MYTLLSRNNFVTDQNRADAEGLNLVLGYIFEFRSSSHWQRMRLPLALLLIIHNKFVRLIYSKILFWSSVNTPESSQLCNGSKAFPYSVNLVLDCNHTIQAYAAHGEKCAGQASRLHEIGTFFYTVDSENRTPTGTFCMACCER